MKKIILNYGNAIASLSFFMAAVFANTTCTYVWHQPKLPEGVKKLRRF